MAASGSGQQAGLGKHSPAERTPSFFPRFRVLILPRLLPFAAAAVSETLGACARLSATFNPNGTMNPVTQVPYLAPTSVSGNKPPDESAGECACFEIR